MRPEQKVRLILIGPAVLAIIILSGCFGDKSKQDKKQKNKPIHTKQQRGNGEQ